MRGTHSFVREHCGVWGIIPAYAGNTYCNTVAENIPEDHPRVCGEHLTENEAHRAGEGSSPRMRGTPNHFSPSGLLGGIIPAYAGNTQDPRPK